MCWRRSRKASSSRRRRGVQNIAEEAKKGRVEEGYLQFVVETQLDVRHAAQEHLHHNFAVHITPQHRALVAHQHVHLQAHKQYKSID